jgi:predicted phosphodiesterase
VRVCVISDIHGNADALAAVLEAVDREAPGAVWCLGDLVGYGPRPNECCARIAGRADISLCGNHDLGVLGAIDLTVFSDDAAEAALWTRTVLAADSRDFLAGLAPKREVPDAGAELFHGSPRDPVWEYVLTEEAAQAALERTSAPIVLVGHSHVPLAVTFSDGGLEGGLAPGGTRVHVGSDRWLLNPGSVGQPRDGDPRAAYLSLDLEARYADFRRVAYAVEETQAEIRRAGLPESLAVRLAYGE